MSFRTVYITEQARCSYQNGYLVVRQDDQVMIHLSEIDTVVVESTATYVSAYLMAELALAKIPVLFCDLKHNPVGQYVSLYGSHDNVRKIKEQLTWDTKRNGELWQRIVKSKIMNQARVLEAQDLDESTMLYEYADDVQVADATNREGHAAKVYFNALFGMGFNRDLECSTNAILNYGYAILLSWMNKEITARGYLTQVGITHRNDYNQFNLSCDFMEPFRPVIDKFVLANEGKELDKELKVEILKLLNSYYEIDQGRYLLSSIMSLYVKNNLAILCDRSELDSYVEFDLNAE